MTTKYNQGDVLTGKVTGIQPYGAFVALDESTQGLVHISEITHGFVKDVSEYLSVGDEVQVKVLQVDEEKDKISLSIRATQEAPKAEAPKRPKRQASTSTAERGTTEGFNTLRDKLQEWIEKSERKDLIKK